jgi:hypothetical protein
MFGSLGIPELIFFGGLVFLPLGLMLIAVIVVWRSLRGRAKQFGYSSFGEFLRAAPATDAEKRHATDLMLKGIVICLSGLLFPPALLVGIFPLFYGGRKVCYASMGLGLMQDADPSQPAGRA